MEAIKKDDLFDEELCGLVKFTDETTMAQEPAETKKKTASKEPAKEKKVEQEPTSKPADAEYEPVKTWFDEKTTNLVKWVLIFIGLEYVVFYWQQTGQMESSAAVPSMIVCALLAGITVGKNWKWRNF